MFAWIPVIEAVPSPIPTASLWFDPTPLGFVALVLASAAVGTALGSLMRTRRPWTPIGFDAAARPAGA